MKAYSPDLRQRVVAACDACDGTREEIAARFSVTTSWIRKLFRQRRATGSIDPRPHGGGRSLAFDEAAVARLREAVRADSDATLHELARASGVDCSVPAVHRTLKRLGLTRKKSRNAPPSKTAPN